MLYSDTGNIADSYKERNLYYKVFCGYLFNEFVENYDERIAEFFNVLIKKYNESILELEIRNKVSENIVNKHKEILLQMKFDFLNHEGQVGFDHHLIQSDENKDKDRGEVADILISTKKNLICIEAKYLTGWKFKKDIDKNRKRIRQLKNREKMEAIQVLLVTKDKWEGSKSKINQHGSNFKKLKDYFHKNIESEFYDVPFIVLLWDDILENMPFDNYESIKGYLERKLNRT